MAHGIQRSRSCATDFVLQTVSSRWSIAIIKQLATGPKRPSQLTRGLGSISAKTLTLRLRELEEVGVLRRDCYQEIPPRVVYTLTPRGQDLLFLIEALRELGVRWQRTLPAYQSWKPIEQCAHCYEHIGPEMLNEPDHRSDIDPLTVNAVNAPDSMQPETHLEELSLGKEHAHVS